MTPSYFKSENKLFKPFANRGTRFPRWPHIANLVFRPYEALAFLAVPVCLADRTPNTFQIQVQSCCMKKTSNPAAREPEWIKRLLAIAKDKDVEKDRKTK
jgi:hypothetical protein